MSVSTTTNYGLTRVRDQGPEANDWAATDKNPELISDILKAFEQHAHNANTPPTFPSYYAPPAAPTITPQGTSGATTYSYYIVANTATFDLVSQIGTTTSGNATLTGVNKNHITWAAVPGATSYDVIRTVGGATQGSIALATAGTSFDDTGIVATLYTPAIQPNVTQTSTGGVLSPGTSVGVRLSYVNALGLETQASPERIYSIPVTGAAPNAPSLTSTQVATPGLAGGTYFYVLTKTKGSGETVISEVTPVSIPFDTTYSVTLGFSAINSYSDGTNGLNLYRSTGLNSSFQLITQISTVSTATFTDTNNILAQNTNRQPPTTSTFGASAKLTIDWSLLTHPTTVSNMNVYLTQQPGVWTTNHLLTQVAITSGSPASTFIDYLGNESLGSGAPTESTQIPANPPKLNLATEATGAPILTADMDFAGFKAKNMSINFVPTATLADGMIWYDSSTGKFRGRQSGASIDLSSPAVATNGTWNPSFEVAINEILVTAVSPASAIISHNTTDGVVGLSNLQIDHTTNGSASPSLQVLGLDTSNSTTKRTTTLPVKAGDVVSISAAVKAVTAEQAATTFTLQVYDVQSDGVTANLVNVTALGTGAVITRAAPVTGTWYLLQANYVVPNDGTTYVAPALTINGYSTTNALVHSFRVDTFAAISALSSATITPYFDGDTAGAYWKGTAHNSASIKGGFQHGANEIGGHDASHIIFGTSDVSTVLSRIAHNTDGTPLQVQTVQRAPGTSTSYTTTSTTPVQIADMTASITPNFANQYIEIIFGGLFTIDKAGGTVNITVQVDGVTQNETTRAATASVNNAKISLQTSTHVQLATVASHTISVYWWVDSGTTGTAVGLNRVLVAKLVF